MDGWLVLVPIGTVFLCVAWMVISDLRRLRAARLVAAEVRRSSFLEEDTEWGGEE